MPRITYQEIRPGKWFKLVDGQIVAAATPSEVAAWRRDGTAPGTIWQDVLKTARPTAGPADKSETSVAQASQQDSFWKDIVKSTKTQPRAQSPAAPAEDRTHPLRPRGKEDIDVAEQASIWRDVLNQSKKRVQPTASPIAAPSAKAREPEKPTPARTVEPAKPSSPSVKVPENPTAVRAAPSQKVKHAPAKGKAPIKAKAPHAAGKKKPTVASAKPRPATSAEVPAARASTEKAAKPARIDKQSPAKAARAAAEPKAAPRKKPKAAAAEPSAPLYLWMVAGQSDDLLAIVRTGLARYQQRFERAAEVVLCHSEDLPTLEGKLSVDLREGKSLPRRNIWIGLK